MDEEEIDAWYEEQKDKLTESYRLKIAKVKNKDALKKNYLKKLDNLHRRYESISEKTSNLNLKWFFINYRLSVFREWLFRPFMKLKEKFEERGKKPEA